MFQSRRLFIPALVATFVGGALAATALTGASATGGAATRTSPLKPSPAPAQAGVSPQSAGCTVHLTAGATPAQNYDACISGHGNVNGFSWGDASVGGPDQFLDNEGYCISRDDDFYSDPPPVSYYDAGSAGEGGFGAATTSMGSAKTYQVVRSTLDGKLTVTQNFFLKPATSQLFIGVIVKNLDSVSHHLRVERYFHPNLTSFGSVLNWPGASGGFQSINVDSSNNTGFSYQGVQLHATSRNVYAGPSGSGAWSGRVAATSFASNASSCGAVSRGVAASPGDNYGGVTELTFPNNTPKVAPGGSLTFQFVYRIY